MPTKRKFTAKFPTTRIKKIMQLDEDIGKLTATVPPVVSRSLELFMEQLVTRAYQITLSRNSKTISPSSIKYVIENESEFGFLKNLVADIPGIKSLPQNKKPPNASRSGTSLENSDSSDDEQSGEDCVSPIEHGPSKCTPRKRQRTVRHRSVPSEDHLADGHLIPFEGGKSRTSVKRTLKGVKSQLEDVKSPTKNSAKLGCSAPFPPHPDNHGSSYVDCHTSPV
ncbi:Dr1-associated corepressor [Fasciola hepatica]|uniref:Dr1-associated corepressor n=1 Tax=Fasciola hepatica TaxID=6192 RepID=A0A2H1CE13_FASHE|nr:Dr1-associated corepressor [Fasciola hepatica]